MRLVRLDRVVHPTVLRLGRTRREMTNAVEPIEQKRIYRRYTEDIHNIYRRYIESIQNIYRIGTEAIQKIYRRYTEDIQKINRI